MTGAQGCVELFGAESWHTNRSAIKIYVNFTASFSYYDAHYFPFSHWVFL